LRRRRRNLRRATAPFRALRDAFQNPQLRALQLAWAGVSFATWAFAISLGVYAFEAAGAAAVGIAALVRLLPGGLATPFGGMLGDRHSRRSVLLWSTAAATMALAAAAGATIAGAPTAVVFAFTALDPSAPHAPLSSRSTGSISSRR